MLGLYLLRAERDLPPMGMAHDEIAQRIYAEHRGGVRFHSLARDLDIPDVDTAYRIQQRYTELMIGTEGDPVGYKIGLTSSRMQRMCNIDSPVSGAILANRVHRSGGELELRRYGRLGVEFEIALLAELEQVMKDASICGLGQTAYNAVESAIVRLRVFP